MESYYRVELERKVTSPNDPKGRDFAVCRADTEADALGQLPRAMRECVSKVTRYFDLGRTVEKKQAGGPCLPACLSVENVDCHYTTVVVSHFAILMVRRTAERGACHEDQEFRRADYRLDG